MCLRRRPLAPTSPPPYGDELVLRHNSTYESRKCPSTFLKHFKQPLFYTVSPGDPATACHIEKCFADSRVVVIGCLRHRIQTVYRGKCERCLRYERDLKNKHTTDYE
jgi:hypothetical protein